ncbi:MAG: hypothetical protein HY550_05255 [Elusimicrobia bacterium]|nr:hypothetical protein [Elusimicrobiota bacterium]
MSVSSHLNPEPERRLWIMHGNMRRAVERADLKLGALTAFAAAEAAFIKFALPGLPQAYPALLLLAAVVVAGLVTLSPLMEAQRQLSLLDPRMDKRRAGDCLIYAPDIAKYPQVELVILLDKYLGGGVTATPYYEDIVGQIVVNARIATRKQRFLLAGSVPAVLVQLVLLWRLVRW